MSWDDLEDMTDAYNIGFRAGRKNGVISGLLIGFCAGGLVIAVFIYAISQL